MGTAPPAKTEWRFRPGEEARLTDAGAVVVSQGTLPFRARDEGQQYLRAPFPGTAVKLGSGYYEVLAEDAEGDAVVYRLRPWPADAAIRDQVVYDVRLVRHVLHEREQAERRHKARVWSWMLAPLVGLLPEEEQLVFCDHYGIDSLTATRASCLLEIGAVFAGVVALPPEKRVVLIVPLFAIVFPALLRALGAFLFKDVAGQWLISMLAALRGSASRRLDKNVLPLGREAFWARLASADRYQREAERTVLVSGTLAHLTWDGRTRFPGAQGDYWVAQPLPPNVEKGRLVYRFRLIPQLHPHDSEATAPEPPHPRTYQESVLEGVAREWDDVLSAFAWLVSLLPVAVQRRAVSRRGGPKAIAGATRLSAGLELIGAAWLFLGPGRIGPIDGILGAFLLTEGAMRLYLAAQGELAPSVFGLPFRGLLRPERVAYHAHRDAEREALIGLAR